MFRDLAGSVLVDVDRRHPLEHLLHRFGEGLVGLVQIDPLGVAAHGRAVDHVEDRGDR